MEYISITLYDYIFFGRFKFRFGIKTLSRTNQIATYLVILAS